MNQLTLSLTVLILFIGVLLYFATLPRRTPPKQVASRVRLLNSVKV